MRTFNPYSMKLLQLKRVAGFHCIITKHPLAQTNREMSIITLDKREYKREDNLYVINMVTTLLTVSVLSIVLVSDTF